MKSIIYFLLGFSILSNLQSQNPHDLLTLKSNEWARAVEKLEPICDMPRSNWINIQEGEQVWKLQDKFTFIITGSLENPKCLENLKVLNQLQYVYPHINVLYINQSLATYPTNSADLYEELIRYDIGVKSHFDRNGNIACLPFQKETRTIMVSPQGKIFGTLDNWLNIDKLIDLTTEYTNRILDVYNLRPQPFYGKKPSQKYKTPVLQTPMYIAGDPQNNKLFVSDYMQSRILVLSPDGQLLNIIGNGRPRHFDGDFQNVSFNGNRGIAYDQERNTLYIADSKNGRIKAADLSEQTVKTVLGNGVLSDKAESPIIGNQGSLPYPIDLTIQNSNLYISTVDGLWKMDLNTNIAELVSKSERLDEAYGIEVLRNGKIFLSNAESNSILTVEEKQAVTINASSEPGYRNGKKGDVLFNHPKGFSMDGDVMYLADQYNNSIRVVNTSKLKAATLTGDTLAGYRNGSIKDALFRLPTDVFKLNDKFYCADMGNHAIRVIDETNGEVSTLRISEYERICYGYKPPVMELNDGPNITLAGNDSLVTIEFQLSSTYVFDPEGASYLNITTRNQEAVALKDEDITDGNISFAIRDSLAKPMDVTIDLFMYFYDREVSGISYFKSTSYTFPISKGKTSNEIEPVTIEIK